MMDLKINIGIQPAKLVDSTNKSWMKTSAPGIKWLMMEYALQLTHSAGSHCQLEDGIKLTNYIHLKIAGHQ
jgi:hypothetical protein